MGQFASKQAVPTTARPRNRGDLNLRNQRVRTWLAETERARLDDTLEDGDPSGAGPSSPSTNREDISGTVNAPLSGQNLGASQDSVSSPGSTAASRARGRASTISNSRESATAPLLGQGRSAAEASIATFLAASVRSMSLQPKETPNRTTTVSSSVGGRRSVPPATRVQPPRRAKVAPPGAYRSTATRRARDTKAEKRATTAPGTAGTDGKEAQPVVEKGNENEKGKEQISSSLSGCGGRVSVCGKRKRKRDDVIPDSEDEDDEDSEYKQPRVGSSPPRRSES